MTEWWRKNRINATNDGLPRAKNSKRSQSFFSGPWNPKIAQKMPWEVLVKGPQDGAIDAVTRQVIDAELVRRSRSLASAFANVISLFALAISFCALMKD